MTLREIQVAMALRLRQLPALRENAARDADLLILHALQATRTEFFARPERPLTEAEIASIHSLIHRRAALEPIQYITGTQEFYGLPFRVTRDTLIPRPETELLVETVLARMPHAKRIVDVGTGTGAIAVSLAHALPHAIVEAIDISEAALEIARENADTNGVTIQFRLGDLLADTSPGVDVVVSNPPYIPESDRTTMHPQVTKFEPSTALFAGPDGLDIYRRLIPQAWDVLRPGSILAMEIGFGQQDPILALMHGWDHLEFLEDLQGISRVVIAAKPSQPQTDN